MTEIQRIQFPRLCLSFPLVKLLTHMIQSKDFVVFCKLKAKVIRKEVEPMAAELYFTQ